MKWVAWCVLGGTIAFLVAYTCALPHDPPKLRRLRRHFLKMRDKGVVFDKPVDDNRSSIRTHNQIIGRKA